MQRKYTLRQIQRAFNLKFINLKDYTLDSEFGLLELAKTFNSSTSSRNPDVVYYDWSADVKTERETLSRTGTYFEPIDYDKERDLMLESELTRER